MSLQLIQAARAFNFKPEDGWPETFTAQQVIELQTFVQRTQDDRWARHDLTEQLAFSLETGDVQVTTTDGWAPPSGRRVHSPGIDSYGNQIFREPPAPRKIKVHHVTAQAFASWLAGNKMQPSDHTAAWFKACGVVTSAGPAEAAVAETVRSETTQQRNARWLAALDDELRKDAKAGVQARAIKRILQAEPGVTEATAKKGLQNAEKDRAETYRDGRVTPLKRKPPKPATPFDGLTKKR